MPTTTVPQPDESTVWTVAEEILTHLSIDPVLSPKYLDKSLHLDWWWEQPFFEGSEYALPPLCIYLEGNVVELHNENDRADRVTVNFTVYVEWRSNADSHIGALTRSHFLGFKPWVMAVHRALQGFKSDNMHTKLRRVAGPVNVTGLERGAVLISQTYRCILYDRTATKEKIMAHLEDFRISGETV